MSATVLCDFNISARLLDDAEARHQVIDGGHTVPVLCFAAQVDTAIGTVCRVQQHFPVGHERQCEARAKSLRKGTLVHVTAPSVGVELVLHNATHVRHDGEEADACHKARQASEAVPA